MEETHFPGYGRCIACCEIINKNEFRHHTLNCRAKPSNEKKFCPFCKEEFDLKQLEEHIQSIHEQVNVSPENLADDDDNSPYQTPRAQTPEENEKNQSKLNSNTKKVDQTDLKNSNELFSDDNNDSETLDSSKNTSFKMKIQSSREDQKNFEGKKTKFCALCEREIDQSEYRKHVLSCSNDSPLSNYDQTKKISIDKQNLMKKEKKVCPLCDQLIEEIDLSNHFQSCSMNQSNSQSTRDHSEKISFKMNQLSKEDQKNLEKKKTKFCALCEEEIDQSEYRKHVASCSSSSSEKKYSKSFQNEKSSSTNDQDQSLFIEKRLNCDQRISLEIQRKVSKDVRRKEKRFCALCEEEINQSEYRKHVASCSNRNFSSLLPISERIDQNERSNNSLPVKIYSRKKEENFHSNHLIENSNELINEKKDCFICFQSIDQSEFTNHVSACAAQLDEQSNGSTKNRKLICFMCNCSIKKEEEEEEEEEKNVYEILCHSRHTYCLSCLRNSMKDFAQNHQIPICHRRLCDYQLSYHEISIIPLERYLSDRLLKLFQGEQRPICFKCHFYVHVDQNESLNEHLEICNNHLIPCEYCLLPIQFNQLEDHQKQCQIDSSSLNEKLINFILPRTKYPFSKEQINFFIQQQKKNNQNQLGALEIVQALAVYGPTFPYEIPQRECGICMEYSRYDDIYVFDCDQSHKICYNCYYQSCQTKMNEGEILTCALCTHLLGDGELNQLRISNDQLERIRNYQIKKTFDVYSNRTRGIIKCPNEHCTWIAEAADPNERFRVQCPQCQREFCSLCNEQYHYRTTCQQLPQITQRWFFWCETERQRYLNIRAQQDQQFAIQLAQYNKQTNENNNRNRDLRRRYEELINDEQYKVQNCRLCPSCNRVVQRLEGCDAMICGQDAHGGNVQSGCGATFNWQQAQGYKAVATRQLRETTLDLPKPENEIVHHHGVKCDRCENDINGIRFDCVHCPALIFCEKCEQEATLNHSAENQAFEQQQHVFKLIMLPEEEANQC